MAEKYIPVEAFTDAIQERYCYDCDRRKGMKRGKLKMVYAIGDVPCRSCGIMDMLDEVEDFPAADVAEIVRCRDCKHKETCESLCSHSEDWFCGDGEREEK